MRVSRELLAFAATSVLSVACPVAFAADWINHNGGNWSDPANWADGEVPDTPDEAAAMIANAPFDVTLDMSVSIGRLRVGEDVTLNVPGGQSLQINWTGGLPNGGLINLNSDGSDVPAVLRFATKQAIWVGRSGSIVLGAVGDDLSVAQIITDDGTDIVNNPAHTIRGSGIVDALMYEQLGRIIADAPGHELEIRNFLMQWGNDGNGSLEADAGVLSLNGAEIWCGSFVTRNGGLIEAKGADSAIGGIEIFGDLAVRGGGILTIQGDVGNFGVVTVNTAGVDAPTTLRIDKKIWKSGTTSLVGVGVVHLNADSQDFACARVATAESVALVLGEGQTVTGRGLFDGRVVNEGVISPGGAGVDTIKLSGSFVQTSGAVLEVDIAGTADGDIDRLENTADLTIESGATIVLRNAAGFAPAPCDSWTLVSGGGTLHGRFGLDASATDPPPGLVYRLFHDEAGGTVTLAAVCEADITADCNVDLDDLVVLLSSYGAVGDALPEDGDLDGDGEVGLSDLAILLAYLGESCDR